MIKLDNVIQLHTHDLTKRLVLTAKYCVESSFTFELSIANSDFAGSSHFCVRQDQVEMFINSLEDISGENNLARLDDNDSDGFIEIARKDTYGHVSVHGQAGGTYEDHATITFATDQTVLPDFIKGLKTLLEVAH